MSLAGLLDIIVITKAKSSGVGFQCENFTPQSFDCDFLIQTMVVLQAEFLTIINTPKSPLRILGPGVINHVSN